MKRFFIVLAVVFVLAAMVVTAAADVTFSWDPPTTNVDNTPLTDLAGYNLYYGTESGNYTDMVDVGCAVSCPEPTGSEEETYTISGLSDGVVYYFAVTAYDTAGNESDYSNEVSKLIQGVTLIEIGNLRIVANAATAPGYTWCWDWNNSDNLAGYHVIWARYRDDLDAKVANLTDTVPSTEYRFAYTDCSVLDLPEFWQVTHIAVIAEDTSGNLGPAVYGHYLYGDIADTHNDGYTYQESVVFTNDVIALLSYELNVVTYTTNIAQFEDGVVYDLPAATELELADLYQDANDIINYFDYFFFGWYAYGWYGTD